MIQVLEHFDSSVEAEVCSFLANAPAETGVTGEHDPRWLHVLHDALRHRPFMVITRNDEGQISGFLPLVLVAGPLFGRFLVSLPYLNRAGVVALQPQTKCDLIDEAVRLANRLNVQYLELRHETPIEHAQLPQRRDEKSLMILPLGEDEQSLWQSIGPKVRNQIRKGDKCDLSIRWGRLELVDDFYAVFSVNMRDLGTPVYPRKLFTQILTDFEKQAELAVVDCQGSPVAAALLIHDRNCTQVPSASCLRQYNSTNANMWMYHRLLLRAIERGSAQFDFGRSSEGTGTYRFKKQWGAQPQPTVWQYHVRRGDINIVRPDNPHYRRRIATWRKLPVWVTRLVGPTIVRWIP